MISFTFIREQRQEKGLSQEQLATQANLDPAYLSRLEQDRLVSQDPDPTVGMLQRLYHILNGI